MTGKLPSLSQPAAGPPSSDPHTPSLLPKCLSAQGPAGQGRELCIERRWWFWTCPCLCPPRGSSGGGRLTEQPLSRESERAPVTTVLITAGQSFPSPALYSCGWEGLAKVTQEAISRARAQPTPPDSEHRAPSCTAAILLPECAQILLSRPGAGPGLCISSQFPGVAPQTTPLRSHGLHQLCQNPPSLSLTTSLHPCFPFFTSFDVSPRRLSSPGAQFSLPCPITTMHPRLLDTRLRLKNVFI